MTKSKNALTAVLLVFFLFTGCNDKKKEYKSPAGYDLSKSEKFMMNNDLKEISGIGFLNGSADSTIAIADEKGKLFYFSLGIEKFNASKFSKKGDFEDVAILNNSTIAVLKSEGSILLFGSEDVGKENIDSVREFTNILPAGEYEGLAASNGKLFALCKNCEGDKQKKEVSVHTVEQINGGPLSVTNSFKIDLSIIQAGDAGEKAKFHPSGIAKHPITGDWFIISSVNKLLLVLDEAWKVKESFPLDPVLFKQPEGIAFNSKGDLYISNEGIGGVANILSFKYQKP
jgi:hypothetical protein